jgi:hypothetical protein
MDISTLTLKLFLLLIPGIIAATVYKKLIVSTKMKSDFLFLINSFVLGIITYLLLQILYFTKIFTYNIFKNPNSEYKLLETFSNISDSNRIPFLEILFASLLSIIIGLFVTYLDSKKILHHISNKLNISNKYGDENLFTNFLNSNDLEWVYVRDLKNQLTYKGSVKMFSETENLKEIVLENVTVFNYPDSLLLYSIPKIYLSLQLNEIIIEQAINKTIENGKKEKPANNK